MEGRGHRVGPLALDHVPADPADGDPGAAIDQVQVHNSRPSPAARHRSAKSAYGTENHTWSPETTTSADSNAVSPPRRAATTTVSSPSGRPTIRPSTMRADPPVSTVPISRCAGRAQVRTERCPVPVVRGMREVTWSPINSGVRPTSSAVSTVREWARRRTPSSVRST